MANDGVYRRRLRKDVRPTERFSSRVENYSKYRPGYPPEIVRLFKTDLDLDESTTVADIGSGTGISSRLFLGIADRVFGIEPNDDMRRVAERDLAEFKNLESIKGSAEDTGLSESCVDIVAAFQAFHWFNNRNAVDELHRILKPSGYIALVWNERLLDANEFLSDYEELLLNFGTDYDQIRHDTIDTEMIERSFEKKFSLKTFPNEQVLDFEGFKGRTLSASYLPAAGETGFDLMLENLRGLFARYQEKGRIRIQYITKAFFTQV